MELSTPFDQLTVNDVIRRFPAAIAVFAAFSIDTCCGGALPVAEAASRRGVDAADLRKALEAIAAEAE